MIGSWVIRNKETKEVICEIFTQKFIASLNEEKYEAVPIAEYLGELNRAVKDPFIVQDCNESDGA